MACLYTDSFTRFESDMQTPSTMDASIGFSVSLKLNKTSVMLYRNGYRKATDGGHGASTQTYLCSFSRECTDIPPEFEEKLRQATAGNPKRYATIMEKIRTDVLEPARKKAQEQQFKAQEERVKGSLSFALQQIESAASCGNRDAILANEEIQQALRRVERGAKNLLVEPKALQVAADAQAQDAPSPEREVIGLLETINQACTRLKAIMPFDGGFFARNHQFDKATVELVQQMWFRVQHAHDALTMHKQLHRPKNWTRMQKEVMGLLDR